MRSGGEAIHQARNSILGVQKLKKTNLSNIEWGTSVLPNRLGRSQRRAGHGRRGNRSGNAYPCRPRHGNVAGTSCACPIRFWTNFIFRVSEIPKSTFCPGGSLRTPSSSSPSLLGLGRCESAVSRESDSYTPTKPPGCFYEFILVT